MTVLTINAGSSSIRLAAFAAEAALTRVADVHEREDGVRPAERLRAFLRAYGIREVSAIAHRVVHGGRKYTRPHIIDRDVEAEIERLAPLAPLHNPIALDWIRACREFFGAAVAQVAVFDTGFYADLPDVAAVYPLPRTLCAAHDLRRYGFHGLAHEAMWHRWRARRPELEAGGRVISLQLGAGCSITAIARGNPIDTSMGFTPLEGLVMATRSGDVDPGLLLYLQRGAALQPPELERVLSHESGLQGLAGEADMRALLARDDRDARLAVALYCYRARKYIGAYYVALGGVDGLLFGGGVGEHSTEIRRMILTGLEPIGVKLDLDANRAAVGREARISRDDSRVEVWAVPVDEAQALARAAFELISPNPDTNRI